MFRRRLAFVVTVVAGVGVVGSLLASAPRDATVDVRYGAGRAGLRRATLAYERDGEVARRVTFAYAGGAPEAQRHVARLRPGDYALAIELEYDGRRRPLRRFFRILRVPRIGEVTVRVDVGAE